MEGDQDLGDGGCSGHMHFRYLSIFWWIGLLRRAATWGAPGPVLAQLSSGASLPDESQAVWAGAPSGPGLGFVPVHHG